MEPPLHYHNLRFNCGCPNPPSRSELDLEILSLTTLLKDALEELEHYDKEDVGGRMLIRGRIRFFFQPSKEQHGQ